MRMILLVLLGAALGVWFSLDWHMNAIARGHMDHVMDIMIERRDNLNDFAVGRAKRNLNTRIPKANPDNMTAACVFDISEGPVRVQVPVGEYYTSVSVFAGNSDVIYIKNDQDIENETLDLTIGDGKHAVPGGSDPVVSADDRGIVLVRMFSPFDSYDETARALLETASCAQI